MEQMSKILRQNGKKSKMSMEPILQDYSVTSLSDVNSDTLLPPDSSFFKEIEDYGVVLSDLPLNRTENVNLSVGPYPPDSTMEENIATKENTPVFKKPFRTRSRKRPRSNLFDSIFNNSQSGTPESQVLRPLQRKAKSPSGLSNDSFNNSLVVSNFITRRKARGKKKIQGSVADKDLQLTNSESDTTPSGRVNINDLNTVSSNSLNSSQHTKPEPQNLRSKKLNSNKVNSLVFDDVFDSTINGSQSDTSTSQKLARCKFNLKKVSSEAFNSVFDCTLNESHNNKEVDGKSSRMKIIPKKVSSSEFKNFFEDTTDEYIHDKEDSGKLSRIKIIPKKISSSEFKNVFEDTTDEYIHDKEDSGKLSRMKINSRKVNPTESNFDGVFSDSVNSSQDIKQERKKLLSHKIKGKNVNSLVFDDVFNNTSNGSQNESSTSQKQTRHKFNFKKVSSEAFDSVLGDSLNKSHNNKETCEKLTRLRMNSKKINSALFSGVFVDSINESLNNEVVSEKLPRIKINSDNVIPAGFNDILDESFNESCNNKQVTKNLAKPKCNAKKQDVAIFNDVFEDSYNSQHKKSASENKECQSLNTLERANEDTHSVATDFSLHLMSSHLSGEENGTNICLEAEAEQIENNSNSNMTQSLRSNLISEKKDSKLVNSEINVNIENCVAYNSIKEETNVDFSEIENFSDRQPVEVSLNNNESSRLSDSEANATSTFSEMNDNQPGTGSDHRSNSFENNSDNTLTQDEGLLSDQEHEMVAGEMCAEHDLNSTLVEVDHGEGEHYSLHYLVDSKQETEKKHELCSKIVNENELLGFNMDVTTRKSGILLNAHRISSFGTKKRVSFHTSKINEVIISSTPITKDKVRVSFDTRFSVSNYSVPSPHADNPSEINKTSFSLDSLVIEGPSENVISNSATIDLHPSTIKSNSASTNADSNLSTKSTSQTSITIQKNSNLNVSEPNNTKNENSTSSTARTIQNEQSEKSELLEDGEAESESNVKVSEEKSVYTEELEEDETNTENEETVDNKEDSSEDCNESGETVGDKSEAESDEITTEGQSSKEVTEEDEDSNESKDFSDNETEAESDQIEEMEDDEENSDQQSVSSEQFSENEEECNEENGEIIPNKVGAKSDQIGEENFNITGNETEQTCQAESRPTKYVNLPPVTNICATPLPDIKNPKCLKIFGEPQIPALSKRKLQDLLDKIPLSELKKRRKPRVSQVSKVQMQQDEIEEGLKKRQMPGNTLFSKKTNLKKPKKWITPKLYDFLINRLTPKFGIKSRLRAENLVLFMVEHVDAVLKKENNWFEIVEEMKIELANLNVIKTHWDFHELVSQHFDAPFYDKLYMSGVMNTLEPENPDETIL